MSRPVALSLGVLLLAGCRAEPDPHDVFVAGARKLVPRVLAESGVPGAAVVMVGRDGFEWAAGFGIADDGGRPVDADTLFAIQSMTKTFTALGVMVAVQEGRLDLDRPITTWLPEFTVRSRFEGSSARAITLRELLSHRAGLTHEAPVGNNLSSAAPAFEAHVASISDTWLRYPVGDRYAYSNLGVDLAGAVLARATGESYAGWMRERILVPLGMKRTAFATKALLEVDNRALGHHPGAEALPVEIPILPSGGLYTSARDLARFVRAQLDRGEPLLSEASWNEMHRVASPVSAHQASGYGLGVSIHALRDGRTVSAGHGGGGYGFRSFAAWVPHAGVGYAVLTNGSVGADRVIGEVDTLFAALVEALDAMAPFEPGASLTAEVECREGTQALEEVARGAYVGRFSNVRLMFRQGVFGADHDRFVPLCFIDENTLVDPTRGLANSYRLEREPGGRPKRLVGLNTGAVYDYNDGPGVALQPLPARWRGLLGTYSARWWGAISEHFVLREHQGHLYFDDYRLVAEPEQGLFFASNGEALDLRSQPPRWRSIALRKVRAPLDAARRGAVAARAAALFEHLRLGESEAFLDETSTELRQLLAQTLPGLLMQSRSEFGRASPPSQIYVESLGVDSRAILFVPFERETRRIDLIIDGEGRASGLWFQRTPRSWWRAPNEG